MQLPPSLAAIVADLKSANCDALAGAIELRPNSLGKAIASVLDSGEWASSVEVLNEFHTMTRRVSIARALRNLSDAIRAASLVLHGRDPGDFSAHMSPHGHSIDRWVRNLSATAKPLNPATVAGTPQPKE